MLLLYTSFDFPKINVLPFYTNSINVKSLNVRAIILLLLQISLYGIAHIFSIVNWYIIYIEYLLWYHMEKEEMSSPLLNYSIYSILILFMHYIFLHPLCNSLLWMTFFWQIGWRLRQEWDNYCTKDIYIVLCEISCVRCLWDVVCTIEYVWIM